MMMVDMKDVHVVCFALHLAAMQSAKIDPDGRLTTVLWEACLLISLPEPSDPPIAESWRALVKASNDYAQLADQPSRSRPNTIRDEMAAPVCDATTNVLTWH